MRNKPFPNYPDDTDYTTNAPSYYDDLARKQKLIELLAKKIWEYEETLDLTLEEISNRLESYIDENESLMTDRLEQWDLNLEKFPENVELLLQEWLSDGTLDHIINDTIFNWKLDTSIFEQFRDSTTALLQQTMIDLKQFGGIANANFQDSNGDWYEDSNFEIPSFDNTDILQSIYNKNYDFLHLKITDGTYLIDPTRRINIPSNTRIDFSKNAKFVTNNTNNDIYAGFELLNAENVEINNAHFVGDREFNTKTTEGAAHGFDVRGSKNVTINNPVVENCFTDGYYLNGVVNFEMTNSIADNNRRQGISLISGENVRIISPTNKNSNGAPPQMGIDIEPNSADEQFKNIVIENPYSENNTSAGLGINLSHLNNLNTIVDITITGLIDVGSGTGIDFVMGSGNVSPASTIKIIDPKSIDSKGVGIQAIGYKADNSPAITLLRPYVHNPNTSNGTNQRHGSVGISVHTDTSTYPTGLPQGNIEIIEPTIVMKNERTIQRGIFIGYNSPYKKVKVINPIAIDIGELNNLSTENNRELIGFSNAGSEVVISDEHNVLQLVTSNPKVRNYGSAIYSKIIVEGTTDVDLIDWNRWEHLKEVTVVHNGVEGGRIYIMLPVGYTFINEEDAVVTGSLETTVKNSILKFEHVHDKIFRVINVFGTWINGS